MTDKKGKANLPFKNIIKRPARTAFLVFLTALLCLSVFAGSVIVSSLQNGFSSLEDRLGAELMVIPEDAAERSDLEEIVLQGNTGYFYMDSEVVDELASFEGVGRITPQFFLASASASCCSAKVQIIGFDPETDFVIQPWIQMSYQEALKDNDIIVGNGLNAFVGDTILFYGTECRVVAKLAPAGTSYDYSVFTTASTIRTLIRSSLEKKLNNFGGIDPENVVSCVLIDPAEGYSAESLAREINSKVQGVSAVRTRSLVSGIRTGLSGISDIAGVLTAAVWILSLIVLIVAYRLSMNERKKEFAVLRLLGASRKMLGRTVLQEALLVSLLGGMAGIAVGFVTVIPFGTLIEEQLGLPYLSPGWIYVTAAALLSVLAAITAGTVTSAASAYRISRIDAGIILRGQQ